MKHQTPKVDMTNPNIDRVRTSTMRIEVTSFGTDAQHKQTRARVMTELELQGIHVKLIEETEPT